MLGSSIRLQVEPKNEGDPYTVGITIKTAIAFEREYKTTLGEAFSGAPSIEHIAWIAWQATRQSGRVVKPFDQWVENDIEDITLVEEEPNPLVEDTRPMRSLG
tara:strand:- start:58 stop:366 length:309 start_codon:yes stop_codon:yes gene_type:complete